MLMPIPSWNENRDISLHRMEFSLRFSRLALLFAVFLLLSVSALHTQDTRKVTEPHIPAACITLEASIGADHGVISAEDERKLDTERIQHAIDNCAEGRAVVLRNHGQRNVFLSGPIALHSGVTLVVNANTSLVASRDPRIYDLSPGSCGILSERGHGCK